MKIETFRQLREVITSDALRYGGGVNLSSFFKLYFEISFSSISAKISTIGLPNAIIEFINFKKLFEVIIVSVSTIIIVLGFILNDIDYIIKIKYI